ncbi:hypothetical protein UCRPA7_5652 [Phaeoacremonium minimum UCRPA7]|uniref:Copper acquisition factor BIM1-like domain-containing protein n=1 Tax=Phaeoacremonium minimum (strain UCR-PA7) TaxID=1286976 RepID=R8BHT8_PHAM7|nr:hypothetical protein UCRPA7_5652 [Phaeoacremonium minimum UCRPA7]EON98829.1 hypothetical protein UCRPA7_5652 [Phaeoacremonium minimum UCRPA7]
MIAFAHVITAIVWLLADSVHGHCVITYPGWRGNNLITNVSFPYGMQRSYPCGGLDVTQNRTAWPITGGAVALQPGWFAGHATALMYLNIWLGLDPDNYATLWPMFEILGPSDNPYPGTICLPQISLPNGLTPSSGDFATIQVVQTLKSGASLFSCADIVFTDDLSQVPSVNETNCFNSTSIKVESVQICWWIIDYRKWDKWESESIPAVYDDDDNNN